MGFGEIKKLINLARGELGEGSTEMENLEADYESWHRYNVEVERAAARQTADWTMDELVAAKELPANVVSQSTLKIAKKSHVKKKATTIEEVSGGGLCATSSSSSSSCIF
jgi:hypothetical protein